MNILVIKANLGQIFCHLQYNQQVQSILTIYVLSLLLARQKKITAYFHIVASLTALHSLSSPAYPHLGLLIHKPVQLPPPDCSVTRASDFVSNGFCSSITKRSFMLPDTHNYSHLAYRPWSRFQVALQKCTLMWYPQHAFPFLVYSWIISCHHRCLFPD